MQFNQPAAADPARIQGPLPGCHNVGEVMKRLVILGAGTAGTMMANKLNGLLRAEPWQITVIDRDHDHVYQPGLLFLPFGQYSEDEIVKQRQVFLPAEVELRLEGIEALDPDTRTVHLCGGGEIQWDILIVATGTRIAPEDTPGLMGEGWQRDIFDFYTLAGAKALARFLDGWHGGRLVLNVVDMPIKCPVAPLEFLFLADDFFRGRGLRDAVELVYATPLDAAFTKPRASAVLGEMLAQRDIRVEADWATSEVDGAERVLHAWDGRKLQYDLLVTVPLHHGAEVIEGAGMGDDMGFVQTDKCTLQSTRWPHVFAIGDATDLPTSKAGSVAHFEAEVLVDNIVRYAVGRPLNPAFDGHANCFIETGHDKAILIDFNYDTEPLPGKFPLPVVGPFDLLAESRVNHIGKLGFKWVYWNLLLKGRELPLDHRMLMAGKRP